MNNRKLGVWIVAALLGGSTALSLACPVWRTEHKIETTSKIEAHIVIDVRKVEAEAQQVEGTVRGQDDATKAKPDAPPQSAVADLHPARVVARRSLWSIFDFATSASAQTPEDEKAALDRRKSRSGEVEKALTGGCLGENNKGYVEARPCDGSAEAKAVAKKLTEDENKDRKTIYSSAVVKQGHKLSDEGIDAVGQIYAKVIREKLKKGQLFQVPTNDERLQEFKESALGKALGAVKKGDWVRVP